MSAEADSHISPDGDGESRLVEAVTRRQVLLRPPYPLAPSADLLLAHHPRHPRAEAIRALRTRLLLARDSARHTGTIALLSPSREEGRSRLCAELAIAFAQLGRATLLVDADLRHPRQHLLFDAPNQSGLVQALRQNEPPRMHGVQGLPAMALLSSGGIPPNPLELLSGDGLEQFLNVWQRDYDFIVVDTPPIIPYSDGVAIGSVVRRALIVTRAPSTSFKALQETTRQLAAAPIHIVGAVINRF